MEKLKDLKGKHDHLLTKLLKVFLFSCVMIAPIVAGTSQMLYATFNKNAKDSWSESIDYKYESNVVNDVTTDLVRGNIYTCKLKAIPTSNGLYPFTATAIYNFNQLTYYTTDSTSENHYFNVEFRANLIQVRNESYGGLFAVTMSNDLVDTFQFDFVFYTLNANVDRSYIEITKSDFNILESNSTDGFLDNAFYYGMDKMANSDMFSWTKNTGIYTGINEMTAGMDINTDNNILAVLLTYWLLMTAIYIVIDIIIELFVKLTHLLS